VNLLRREGEGRSERGRRSGGEKELPSGCQVFRGVVVSYHFVGRSTESESESSVGDH